MVVEGILLILAYVFAFLAGRELDKGRKGSALTKSLIALFSALVAIF